MNPITENKAVAIILFIGIAVLLFAGAFFYFPVFSLVAFAALGFWLIFFFVVYGLWNLIRELLLKIYECRLKRKG